LGLFEMFGILFGREGDVDDGDGKELEVACNRALVSSPDGI
jgi:hypothetical protein